MIAGEKVCLGPLVPNDFTAIFRWSNDLSASRLNAAYRPVDWTAHKAWCENVGRDPSRVVFAIRRHNQPDIVGYVEIINIHPVHRSAYIGIRIGEEKDRGHGLGTEALRLTLYFCWNHLNLNRVALTTFRHNERGLRAFRAAGFRKEGILRRAEFIDGDWVDVVLMAALRPVSQDGGVRPLTASAEIRTVASASSE
jgi:[ribosomal protein S5]-alanine N-acetyltransferase